MPAGDPGTEAEVSVALKENHLLGLAPPQEYPVGKTIF
jgi:hypothetical protein